MAEAPAATAPALLELDRLDAWYGDSHILQDIALRVAEGEGVALLGRNGAGKSTLLKAIMDAGPRAEGRIRFAGSDLGGMACHMRARLGLCLVPEDRRIFTHTTVAGNLMLARYGTPSGQTPLSVDEVVALLPMLSTLLDRKGYQLSGGQQQMLAVGRGLVPRPRLLMLDEPAEGLAPVIVEELAREIGRIRATRGQALIITEQNVAFARACTDRVYLMESGRIVYSGDWDDFDAHPELQDRHLAL